MTQAADTRNPTLVLGDRARLETALAAWIAAVKRDDPLREVVVATGSNLACGHLSRAVARELGAHAAVRFVSIHALAPTLAAESLERDGLRLLSPLLRERLVAALVARRAAEAWYFAPVARTPGLSRALLRTIDDLRHAGVPVDALAALRSRKGADLKALYGDYVAALQRRRLVDDAGLYELAARAAARGASPVGAGVAVALFGLYDLPAMQAGLVKALAADRTVCRVPALDRRGQALRRARARLSRRPRARARRGRGAASPRRRAAGGARRRAARAAPPAPVGAQLSLDVVPTAPSPSPSPPPCGRRRRPPSPCPRAARSAAGCRAAHRVGGRRRGPAPRRRRHAARRRRRRHRLPRDGRRGRRPVEPRPARRRGARPGHSGRGAHRRRRRRGAHLPAAARLRPAGGRASVAARRRDRPGRHRAAALAGGRRGRPCPLGRPLAARPHRGRRRMVRPPGAPRVLARRAPPRAPKRAAAETAHPRSPPSRAVHRRSRARSRLDAARTSGPDEAAAAASLREFAGRLRGLRTPPDGRPQLAPGDAFLPRGRPRSLRRAARRPGAGGAGRARRRRAGRRQRPARCVCRRGAARPVAARDAHDGPRGPRRRGGALAAAAARPVVSPCRVLRLGRRRVPAAPDARPGAARRRAPGRCGRLRRPAARQRRTARRARRPLRPGPRGRHRAARAALPASRLLDRTPAPAVAGAARPRPRARRRPGALRAARRPRRARRRGASGRRRAGRARRPARLRPRATDARDRAARKARPRGLPPTPPRCWERGGPSAARRRPAAAAAPRSVPTTACCRAPTPRGRRPPCSRRRSRRARCSRTCPVPSPSTCATCSACRCPTTPTRRCRSSRSTWAAWRTRSCRAPTRPPCRAATSAPSACWPSSTRSRPPPSRAPRRAASPAFPSPGACCPTSCSSTCGTSWPPTPAGPTVRRRRASSGRSAARAPPAAGAAGAAAQLLARRRARAAGRRPSGALSRAHRPHRREPRRAPRAPRRLQDGQGRDRSRAGRATVTTCSFRSTCWRCSPPASRSPTALSPSTAWCAAAPVFAASRSTPPPTRCARRSPPRWRSR